MQNLKPSAQRLARIAGALYLVNIIPFGPGGGVLAGTLEVDCTIPGVELPIEEGSTFQWGRSISRRQEGPRFFTFFMA